MWKKKHIKSVESKEKKQFRRRTVVAFNAFKLVLTNSYVFAYWDWTKTFGS